MTTTHIKDIISQLTNSDTPLVLFQANSHTQACYQDDKIILSLGLGNLESNDHNKQLVQFIIGHEHGHSIYKLNKPLILSMMFGSVGLCYKWPKVSALCTLLSAGYYVYSLQKIEYQCDLYAAQNYNKNGGVSLFTQLQNSYNQLPWWKRWFYSIYDLDHPSFMKREKALKKIDFCGGD